MAAAFQNNKIIETFFFKLNSRANTGEAGAYDELGVLGGVLHSSKITANVIIRQFENLTMEYNYFPFQPQHIYVETRNGITLPEISLKETRQITFYSHQVSIDKPECMNTYII